MQRCITILMTALMATAPVGTLAAQQYIPPATEAAAFKAMAAAIPLGTRVKIQTSSGRRLRATLMSVTDEGLVVKRETRVPEPAVTISFSELTRLQRDERGGVGVGKAIGIGLAAGAGAILTLFAIVASFAD
jgi:hypothetical protein